MCEMLVMQADRPVSLTSILPYAALLDEYGVAGFGWGVVWRNSQGELKRYRSANGLLRDQLAEQALAHVTSTEYLIHLRRPSLMTSIAHRNAHPYFNSEKTMAFAHNGYFVRHQEYRAAYPNVEGTSDSEVGFHHFLSLLQAGMNESEALQQLHEDLGGKANLAVLHANGTISCYGGNPDNYMYSFQLDEMRFVSTSLHSHDEFLFEAIFPAADQVVKVPLRSSITLSR